MVRHLGLVIAIVMSAHGPALAAPPQPPKDGLKVWITPGGAYCIREIGGLEQMRCQSEAAWAKQGITFSRAQASPKVTVTAAAGTEK